MADTYYSYTTIKHSDGVVEFGEKVSQADIDVPDEEWQDLIDTNAVGTDPVPEDLKDTESLSQYHVRKAIEAMEAVQAGELPTSKVEKPSESTPSKS